MWTIFKAFIEFVTGLLLFYVLVFWLQGMWDLSPLTGDQTHTPCFVKRSLFFFFLRKRSLNHWTTRQFP